MLNEHASKELVQSIKDKNVTVHGSVRYKVVLYLTKKNILNY